MSELTTFTTTNVNFNLTKMKTTLLFVSLFAFLSIGAKAQDGCTDLNAVNFDPTAVNDDGSCEIYTASFEYDAVLNSNIEVGTGISNEHMAIVNYGPMQLGLKVNNRFISDVIPENENEYSVETGFSRTSFIDPTPNPPLATWDFIYSFDLADYTFETIEAYVVIDFDPQDNPGQAASYELPLSVVLETLNQDQLPFRQGSENLGFIYWQGLAGATALLFDAENPGVYDISLRIENQGGTILTEIGISVIAGAPIDGCLDPAACNYNPDANVEVTCTYAEEAQDCEGNCLNDFDNDGVCDELEIAGCTYPTALNFDPAATNDNNTCEFNSFATLCDQADFDASGAVEVTDLLLFLSVLGVTCE